jgi:hypothetical protein
MPIPLESFQAFDDTANRLATNAPRGCDAIFAPRLPDDKGRQHRLRSGRHHGSSEVRPAWPTVAGAAGVDHGDIALIIGPGFLLPAA